MDNLSQLISVPVITSIVFGAIELYKYITKGCDKCSRFIPLIAGVLGAALGVVAFYAAPSIIAASNVLTAILIGGASGLAATGTHQIFKQISNGCSNAGNSTNTSGQNPPTETGSTDEKQE